MQIIIIFKYTNLIPKIQRIIDILGYINYIKKKHKSNLVVLILFVVYKQSLYNGIK